jgi:hypothetical protein
MEARAHSKAEQDRQQSLSRAVLGQSFSNFPAIFQGFSAKGIPESEIKPRENVFTFDAWKALGRYVRKGEHGVKVVTFIECSKENRDTGERETFRRPWTTTVFHVSQTEAISGGEIKYAPMAKAELEALGNEAGRELTEREAYEYLKRKTNRLAVEHMLAGGAL